MSLLFLHCTIIIAILLTVKNQTDAYFCLSCFRRPFVLQDALLFAVLDLGDALLFADLFPFFDSLVRESFP